VTRIGVLALQGDFAEHVTMLRQLGVDVEEIRLPDQLDEVDGLVIPGGESTTIGKLMDIYKFAVPLTEKARRGFPIWGTCAGLILLANQIEGSADKPWLSVLDVAVQRNAFGRQVASFEADLDVAGLDSPFHAIFIRAPKILSVGPAAEPLATLPDGTIVGARQGNLFGTSFHPELTEDSRIHELFVRAVQSRN